jgi:hypothetical protein
MWPRWLVASAVAAGLLVGLVLAVHRAGPEGPTSEAQAEAETNRIADIAITEDEAPHFATLPQSLPAAIALKQAIGGDARSRIASGQLGQPLQSVMCQVSGTSSSGRTPYHCAVRSAGVSYPFIAVADQHARRLVWCKVDKPAVAGGPEVLVSARCRG